MSATALSRWVRGAAFFACAALSLFDAAGQTASSLGAQEAKAAPRVAVLSLENRSGDPRYDYIGGIVYALAMYDLSASGAVELVDRGAIEAILKERELSMSAIAEPGAAGFSGIVAADWIIAGEYVLLGAELRLTIKLVDVSSSKVSTFSETGGTENLVHGLIETAVEKLTGRRPRLVDDGKSRSILSLRDETPGTIALFSPLIDAKVTLDGEFVGYTTGDRRVPFLIEGVEPGPHEISTDLGMDFGVVKLPEIEFGPWKELVRVQSGKRLTVSDKSSHHNDTLYRLKRLVRESPKVVLDAAGSWKAAYDFNFVDRNGVSHTGRVALSLEAAKPGKGVAVMVCSYDAESRTERFEYEADGEIERSIVIGLVSYTVSVEERYGRIDAELEAERVDIDQGMHRER